MKNVSIKGLLNKTLNMLKFAVYMNIPYAMDGL